MDSVDSLDIVQCPWTKSTESMDWLDIVCGLTGLCPVWFDLYELITSKQLIVHNI